MGAMMPDPVTTQRRIQIEHVRIEAAKPFEAVKAALEELVPPLDPAILEALRQGDIERAKEARRRGPELAIFSARDHGGLLRIADLARKAVQYEIGNPLTATRMTQHQLPASLYAPLRVVLYEDEAGHAVFEYDRPSSLFGQFGDERVTAVARELDASLERVLAQTLHSGEQR
ncbi:MAG TPA: DUF302 domain-containing protein [Bradyrhizobium sp.]|nr:DUF302 domain-containing protein [Bradyrhizobium sp.]